MTINSRIDHPQGPQGSSVPDDAGQQMHDLAVELFPICRSITGNGVRETLRILQKRVPLEIHEVATGTPVFDWQVPREWNIREAWIRDPQGRTIVDFKNNNLHVVNYSVPVRATVDLEELKAHLHTLPEHPEWIPYRTSYYHETWGFCLSHKQWLGLVPGAYEVCIDATLEDGRLSYGEYVLAGESSDEVLLTTHICHPSLANDNLSGIAVMTRLAAWLASRPRKYTYRLLWIPGTIGSIAWLAENRDRATRIKHGVVITCVGDGGGPMYKRSRRDDAVIDRVMTHVLKESFESAVIEPFSPYGYDERQFCSPGFNLPVGLLQRSKHGRYPEYHTSADNLDYIKPVHLAESLGLLMQAVDVLENDAVYINTNPWCEPQLGKRGLYEAIGGDKDRAARQMALLWVLNLSDGDHSLLDIAEKAGLPFREIFRAAVLLEEKQLLRRATHAPE